MRVEVQRKVVSVLSAVGWVAVVYFLWPESVGDRRFPEWTSSEVLSVVASAAALAIGLGVCVWTWRS